MDEFILVNDCNCSLHLQRYKDSAHVPQLVSNVPRLRPFRASAAVLQFAHINKGNFTHVYQYAMSLLVIAFTFLEVRDCEFVVKELAAVDNHSNRVLSYVFMRPYGLDELPAVNGRINLANVHVCN